MKRKTCAAVVVCLGLAAALCEAQVSNLTGMWKLNVAKSRWGKKQKPNSVAVDIEHREPVLKYQGTVVDVHGYGREFAFEGSIDGREYAFYAPYGEGKIIFKRLDAFTVTSVFKSADGNVVETVTMRLSRDGKVLTHQVRLKDPGGEMSWTEIYEKQ